MKKFLFSLLIGISIFVFPNFLIQAKAKSLTLEYDPTNSYNLRNMTDEEIINAEIPNYEQYFKIRDYAKNYLKTNSRYTDYCILSDGGSRYVAYMYTLDDLMFDYLPINVYENTFYDYYIVFFSLVYRQSKVSYYTSFVIDSSTGNVTSTTYSNDWDTYNIGDSTTQRVGSYKTRIMNYDSLDFKMYVDTSLPIKLNTDVKIKSLKYDYVYQLELSFHDVSTDRTISYENEQQIFDENGKLTMPYTLELKEEYRYENYGENLSKIEVIFYEEAMTTPGQAHFKFNWDNGVGGFISETENYPMLTGYKLYGTNVDSDYDNYWEELQEDEYEYFSDINIENINDVDYEYTITLNTPPNMCVHTMYKIEFYFENTLTYKIKVYDDLDSTGSFFKKLSWWNAYLDFLRDYQYFEIHGSDNYALISSNKTDNDGRIYFTKNDSTNLELYNYNFSTKQLGLQYITKIYENNTIYSYADFHFSYNDSEILLLKTKVDADLSNWVSFWVPKGYYVSIVSINEDYEWTDPSGQHHTGSKEEIDQNFSYEDIFSYFNKINTEDTTEIKQLLNEIWNYFKNSKISTYFLILITGTIIALIVTGVNR